MRRALAAIVILLLPACTPATGPKTPPPTLADTSWQITQISGQATTDTLFTLTFTKDRFGAYFGCNQVGGDYQRDGTKFSFGQVTSTLMLCPEPANTFESDGIAALGQVSQIGGSVTAPELLAADGTVLFVLAELPDDTLNGTNWQLENLLIPDPTAAAGKITISISDGTVQGKACNNFHGPLSVSGDQFDAGPLISTRMACVDQTLTTQESQVLQLLETATSYNVQGETLTLLAPDGTGLIFTAIK